MQHTIRPFFILLIIYAIITGCNSSGTSGTKEGATGCSTEQDLKAIITSDKMKGMLAGDLDRDVVFHNFFIDGPMEYTNTSGTAYAVITDEAYRVKTSFDVIRKVDIGVGTQTQRDRYVDVIYTCYTVNWSDGPNCVCYAEKNAYPAVLGEVIAEEKR